MKSLSDWIGSIKGDTKPAKVVSAPSATSELKEADSNGEDRYSISYNAGSKSEKRKRMSIIRKMGMVVDKLLVTGFAGLARFVARHPYATIVTCICLTLILAAGFIRINLVTSLETLYSSPSLPEFSERDFVYSTYGYGTQSVYVTFTPKPGQPTNLVNKTVLYEVLSLYKKILRVNASYNNEPVWYESKDICFRPFGPTSPCQVASVLDLWNYTAADIRDDNNINLSVSFPYIITASGQPVPQQFYMGNIKKRNNSAIVESAGAFLLTMITQNNKPGPRDVDSDQRLLAWQKAVQEMVMKWEGQYVDAWIFTDWGEKQAMTDATIADLWLVVISCIILVSYAFLINMRHHAIQSQGIMSIYNFVSLALGIAAAYGLCCWFAVPFSIVTEALALLLLALGSDDMLVTMAAHEETGREMPDASIEDRVAATVSRARRGVVVAALTNFIAFATGIASVVPAVRWFMIYAAVGIVFVFLYQSTFFVACLVLDMRRQRARRVDALCCIESTAGPNDGFCGKHFDPERESFGKRIFGEYLPKVTLSLPGKVIILVVSIGLTVAAGFGISYLHTLLRVEWVVLPQSYIAKVYNVQESTFVFFSSTGTMAAFAYTRNNGTQNYFDYQDDLTNLTRVLKTQPYIDQSIPIQSWYNDYISWLASSNHSDQLLPDRRPATSDEFYRWLHEYLASDAGKFHRSDVVFDDGNPQLILASRVFFYTVNVNNTETQMHAVDSIRESVANAAPTLDSFAWNPLFVIVEGQKDLKGDLIIAVIIATAAVFVVMVVILADLWSSILVGCMVVLVDVQLFGSIYWIGLTFNTATSIVLLLAVGIAVDYAAFMAFSFLNQLGSIKQERAKKALMQLGFAVFNGGFFIFLSVLPLAFAQSYIFRILFTMFSMLVALGLFNALLLLPVLLSFIGPAPYEAEVIRVESLAISRRMASLRISQSAEQPVDDDEEEEGDDRGDEERGCVPASVAASGASTTVPVVNGDEMKPVQVLVMGADDSPVANGDVNAAPPAASSDGSVQASGSNSAPAPANDNEAATLTVPVEPTEQPITQ